MAKDKEKPNLIVDEKGLMRDAEPQQVQGNILKDLGLDSKFIKEQVAPKILGLVVDASVQGAREQLGLGKSKLREKSTAFRVSTFLKEITSPIIVLTLFVIAIMVLLHQLKLWGLL